MPFAVALALGLRIVWQLLCGVDGELISDQRLYHEFARNIAAGHGYVYPDLTTAGGWWPVGYSAMLAAAYAVFGDSRTVAYGAHLILGALTVFAGHRLAAKLFGPRAGGVTGLVLACHPTLVMLSTTLASENVTIPAALVAANLLVSALRDDGARWGTFASLGLLLGAATYVRATLLTLGLPLVVGGLVFGAGLRRIAGGALLSFGIAALVLLPWGLRNDSVHGRFSMLSMNGASNLWMGNHPGSDGGYHPLPDDVADLTLVEREDLLRDRAMTFIRENPTRYAALCGQRIIKTLQSDTIAVSWNRPAIEDSVGSWALMPLKAACTGAHYLLLISWLALLGRAAYQRNALREHVFVATCIAAMAIPFVAIVGGNRYHLPMMAFVAVAVGSFAVQQRHAAAPT